MQATHCWILMGLLFLLMCSCVWCKRSSLCTTSWRMTEEWLRNDNVKFNEDQVQQDNSAELERFRKVDDSRRTVPTVRVHVPGACQRMNIEHAWCILFRTNMAFSILDSWQHIHTISNYILYRCLGLSWPPPCNLVQAIRLSKGYSSLRFIFYCQSCQVLPHQNGDIFWSSLKVVAVWSCFITRASRLCDEIVDRRRHQK